MKKLLPALLLVFGTFTFALAQSSPGDHDDGKTNNFAIYHGDRDEPKIKIDVFPNPAFDNIFVRIESQEQPKVEFELYNIIGTSLNVESEQIEKNYYKIGVKELPAGYYLLMVKDPVQHFNQAFKIHKATK